MSLNSESLMIVAYIIRLQATARSALAQYRATAEQHTHPGTISTHYSRFPALTARTTYALANLDAILDPNVRLFGEIFVPL